MYYIIIYRVVNTCRRTKTHEFGIASITIDETRIFMFNFNGVADLICFWFA